MSVEYAKSAVTSIRAAASVSGVTALSGLYQVLGDLPDIGWWMSATGIVSTLTLLWIQMRKIRLDERKQALDEKDKLLSMKEREIHIEQMRRDMAGGG
jgi:hypothetical protein